jgi:photosystem II stability/assembly factor-like uncharacterized protein
MKKKSTSKSAFCNLRNLCALIVISGAAFALLLSFGPFSQASGQANSKHEPEEHESVPEDPAARAAWERLPLLDEHGKVPPGALRRAYEEKRAMPFRPEAWAEFLPNSSNTQGPQPNVGGITPAMWTWLGPGNIGGRIRSIVVHPTTPSTIWIGSVGGGVWKTTNSGTSWKTTTDWIANLAVTSIVMDPTNPNVLYAGTGEGFRNGDGIQGDGIFKTTDGGATWLQLPSTECGINTNFCWVTRLATSPTNSQVLLASTKTGIFRSTNGGGSWPLQPQLSGAFTDVLFHPTDGNKCVAGAQFGGRAYYSVDGGQTWTAATGLPASGANRVELAYAPSSPSTVYASVEYNDGQLYRSADGGHSYIAVGAGGTKADWYHNALWIDPTNSNTLLIGGEPLWLSTNGGIDRASIPKGHPDIHAIVNDVNYTTNHSVYLGNDGGIYKIADISIQGATSLNHTLGITQFYAGNGNATNGTILGGAQDNGTLRYTVPGTSPEVGGGPEDWTNIQDSLGGDGGYCALDQTNPTYLYGEFIDLQIFRSTDGGSSVAYIWNGPSGIPADCPPTPCANFIAPFVLDPNDPTANTILGGGRSLWRSRNVKTAPQPTAVAWSEIKPATSPTPSNIWSIATAPGNPNIVWVGHNDGEVYYTTNGTADNPDWHQANLGSPPLPSGRICESIAIDPQNTNRVYVTLSGFNSDNVWRTDDFGAHWTNISNGLPAMPVHSIVVSPSNSNSLYIGTHLGVFATADGGSIAGGGGTWSPTNDGPANVATDQLFWVGTKLVAATHGRGMFTAVPTNGISMEAESGTLTGCYRWPATWASAGYRVDGISAAGDNVAFTNFPQRSYIKFRYSTPNTGTFGLYVNGVRVVNIPITSTGSWGDLPNTYREQTVNVNIPANATVKFQYDTGDVGINLDYVRLD